MPVMAHLSCITPETAWNIWAPTPFSVSTSWTKPRGRGGRAYNRPTGASDGGGVHRDEAKPGRAQPSAGTDERTRAGGLDRGHQTHCPGRERLSVQAPPPPPSPLPPVPTTRALRGTDRSLPRLQLQHLPPAPSFHCLPPPGSRQSSSAHARVLGAGDLGARCKEDYAVTFGGGRGTVVARAECGCRSRYQALRMIPYIPRY